MAKKWSVLVAFGVVSLLLAGTSVQAGGDDMQKELRALDTVTGTASRQAVLRKLFTDKERATKLIQAGLPAAKKKELSYDAALVLGMAAADLKDMKSSEIYFRVCMDKAAKLQSFEKLTESYVPLIKVYYGYKNYADSARVCKELLELNTEDGKDRLVIATMVNRFGEAGFREEQEGFNTAARLRPYIREIYIKAISKQAKHDQAIRLADSEITKRGDWQDYHLKAWVLNEAGKFEDAVGVYEDVIKMVGRDKILEQAEKDEITDQIRYEVSNVYIEFKKIDRATEHLEILVKSHPENAVYNNDLGYILADNDLRLDEAEKLIRKAISLDRARRKKSESFDPKKDQDPGAYLDSLGWVLHKLKKNKEAKDWLIKALEDKSAQHIEIYDHLGDVHMALGETAAAIRAYEGGLKHVTDSRRDQRLKEIVEKKLAKLKQ